MKNKAIIHIGRNVKNGGSFVKYVYRSAARFLIGGDLPGGITGDARKDYEALLVGHHGTGRLIRSAIISVDCPATFHSIRENAPLLAACADDFRNHFAPGRPFLWAYHKNGGRPHLHLAIQNSTGDTCLEWGPDELKAMQDFDWTTQYVSGRGKGLNEVKGRTCYPGKTTTAAKLAGLDVEGLKTLLGSGDLVVSRRRKDGSPLSLVCEGRKMRVQTVCVLAADFGVRLQTAMADDGGNYLAEYLESTRAANQATRDSVKAH